jgi:hypothetical protein
MKKVLNISPEAAREDAAASRPTIFSVQKYLLILTMKKV